MPPPRRQLATLSWRYAQTPILLSLALALGLLIARLPFEYGLAGLAAAVLFAASVVEPAIGLGLAVSLGPAKAFLAAARPDLPVDPGQIFFALALAGWLARGLVRREIKVPRAWLLFPLGLYLVVGLFSLLASTSLEEGLKEALKWIEIAVGIAILISEAERGRAKWIIAAILVAGVAQAAVGVWQYTFRGIGPEHFRIAGDRFRAYGSFEQPNPYGGFLGLIWPLAAGLALGHLSQFLIRNSPIRNSPTPNSPIRNSPIPNSPTPNSPPVQPRLSWAMGHLAPVMAYSAVAGLCLVALYFSNSRGAWLGAGAAALVMAMFLPRRWGLGAGLVVVTLAAGWGLSRAGLLPASLTSRLADVADFTTVSDVRGVNINDTNFSIIERLAHWQAAEAMARAHPWLGVGLGNYAAAYPTYRLLNWPNALGHAHMIYLNVLAETGAAGLVTYVTLWVSVIGLTIRLIGRAHGAPRGLALGLLGAWTHLSTHQLVDNLYVNNIHFLLAALLALLIYFSCSTQDARLA